MFTTNATTAFAQSSCGDIVETFTDWVPVDINDPDAGLKEIEVEERHPIEDCDNPFNADDSVPYELSITLHNQNITPDTIVSLPATGSVPGNYTLQNVPSHIRNGAFSPLQFYRKVNEDYYFEYGTEYEDTEVDVSFSVSDLPEGEYIAVFTFEEPPVVNYNFWQFFLERTFLPLTTYAQYIPPLFPEYAYIVSIPFTIVHETPEPEIDPLILQYAPVLYFHPDEDYFPMNVESFINDSALWDGNSQLLTKGELTLGNFEEIINTRDTSNYNLAYSDPDTAGSIDLEAAKEKYDAAIENKEATTTVYVHRMTDGYTDQSGNQHDFIVLQYWYFYAMNNWAEHGGRNNHEGDWESVFVFLDEETEDPKYVAFSSHLNDGFPNPELFQNRSVRKEWNNLETNGYKINSYVALGSHANYEKNKNYFLGVGTDQTSTEGRIITSSLLSDISTKFWSEFKGFWGTQSGQWGSDGPQGPKFIDLTGQFRYSEPVEWAGLDNIDVIVAEQTVALIEFTKQGIKFAFETAVETGTEIAVDLHEEVINFGQNIEEITLLPNFWDIESSLENDTFNVAVTLSYNPEVVTALDGAEEDLAAHYYNPIEDIWEVQDSVVDTEANIVTFNTTHFSRYALGIVEQPDTPTPPEPATLGELYDELRAVIDDSELRFFEKRLLLLLLDQNERMENRKHSFFSRDNVLLDVFERSVKRYERREKLSEEEMSTITALITQIKDFSKEEKPKPKEKCKSHRWFNFFDQKCNKTERERGWFGRF